VRLRLDLGAFWFQNRATPHGATLGFPGAVVVFSPFEAVFEALLRGGSPTPDSTEVLEVRFVTEEEARGLPMASWVGEVLHAVFHGVRGGGFRPEAWNPPT